MRRPLSVVLARLPFKRPFVMGIAALLLVGLVGAAIWWQVGAHASPARENLSVVSDAGDPVSVAGVPGTAVITSGHAGCTTVDSNGICTEGVWTRIQPPIPGAHWIWPTAQWDSIKQGGNPVTFTKQFPIPDNALSITGQILITADNHYDLQVNGHEVGKGDNDFNPAHADTYDVSAFLRAGSNTITVEATNDPTPTDPSGNPAGLIFRADVSYVPDGTAPTTTASLAGTLGSNGWYRGPVTVTLQASDPDDAGSTLLTNYSSDGGATWLVYSSPLTFATDGQYTLQYRSVDQATNLEATQSVRFQIDQASPVLNVTDANASGANASGAANQSYDVCSTARPVRPSFAPTDATSGLDGSQGDSWSTPTAATGAGTYTYTAHATDVAGNQASETHTYQVLYGAAFRGPTDVFKTDRPNGFKVGSTIPVIFQLLCNGTSISTAVATLTAKPVVLASTPQASQQSGAKDHNRFGGNTFRYWKGLGPYSYYYLLLNTDRTYTNPDGSVVTFAAGTWTFTITLDDGSTHDYTVRLRD